MAQAVLVEGVTEKAASDRVRMPMDFGNEPLLIQGYTIVSYNVSCSDTDPVLITGKQLDYAYQISGLISGGTSGVDYNIVFTLTLDDPDASVITRTGVLKCL